MNTIGQHNRPTRRCVLKTTAIAAASVAMTSTLNRAQAADRKRSNAGRIYKANKGGGIGKDKAAMVARLEQYKSLSFDGLEGGSPGIGDISALQEAISETGVPVHGVVDGVHWRQRLSSPDPKTREIGKLALEQAIKDSYAIRGSTVLLVPGKVDGPDETHDHVCKTHRAQGLCFRREHDTGVSADDNRRNVGDQSEQTTAIRRND